MVVGIFGDVISGVKIVLQRRHFAGTRLRVTLNRCDVISGDVINVLDCIKQNTIINKQTNKVMIAHAS